MARGQGAYQISLFCECGVTLHYSGIRSMDTESREMVELIVARHAALGHQTVQAEEARRIRRYAESAKPENRARKNAQERGRIRGRISLVDGRARSEGSQGRRGRWHALAIRAGSDKVRTVCGLSTSGMVQESRAWTEEGDACQRCHSLLDERQIRRNTVMVAQSNHNVEIGEAKVEADARTLARAETN